MCDDRPANAAALRCVDAPEQFCCVLARWRAQLAAWRGNKQKHFRDARRKANERLMVVLEAAVGGPEAADGAVPMAMQEPASSAGWADASSAGWADGVREREL